MAGGPSTPALVAAVSEAGGLGFLAAGYKSPDAVREEIRAVRELTSAPFGLNLFVPGRGEADETALARYLESLQPDAERLGVEVGEPRWDDDAWDAKFAVVVEERVPIVSTTFGYPPPEAMARLQAAGIAVWVTVTEVDEAQEAREAGADALVVQGVEAGAHRGTFVDEDGRGEVPLLPLFRGVAAAVDLPLVATGGLADAAGVATVLAAGARAAQLGTAFLLCPEAGTSEPHRAALREGGRATVLTRAFTGRRARALENRFTRDHPDAPSAYPQINYATSPLRAAARASGDAESLHLWAGQTFAHGDERRAHDLVRSLDPGY
ncbi:MAG: nitronate monooxygenase [Gaiellaceae bacterium]|jgi:nitronate monooxygenase|nr:nitronate monooxygenase [Gaiellaceae bacterium]